MTKPVIITRVLGIEGEALYINDYRVAGPKPWGDGVLLQTFKAARKTIEAALNQTPTSTPKKAAKPSTKK